MEVPAEVQPVALALSSLVDARVHLISRAEYVASLRPGGKPTRLVEPFEAFRSVVSARGFMCMVASGSAYTEGLGGMPGIHFVRVDEEDGPEGRINTDSCEVIENLTQSEWWPKVLSAAGVEDSDELRRACGEYAYAYKKNRLDHWSPTVPADIDAAEPK